MKSPFKLKKYFKAIAATLLGGAVLLAASQYSSRLIVTYFFPFLVGLVVGDIIYGFTKDQ